MRSRSHAKQLVPERILMIFSCSTPSSFGKEITFRCTTLHETRFSGHYLRASPNKIVTKENCKTIEMEFQTL